MGAEPPRAPLAGIPPASSTPARFASNSGRLKSDTWWPCWAKSNADASPPLPAPSTATRITARAYPPGRGSSHRTAAHGEQLPVVDAEGAARVARGGDVGVELGGARREPLAVVAVDQRAAV